MKLSFKIRQILLAIMIFFAALVAFSATASEVGAGIKKANAAFASGDFVSAKQQFLELEIIAPENTQVLQKIALLYLLGNNAQFSQAYYEKAIENTSQIALEWPNSMELYFDTAMAYFRGDNFARAAQYLGKAAGPHGSLFFDEIKLGQRQLELFKGYDPYIISGDAFVKMPFVKRDSFPVIRVSVNGSELLNFIVDSGAEELAIDIDVATRLGIDGIGKIFVEKGTGMAAGIISFGKVDDIQIGGIKVQNIPTEIMDMGEVSKKVFTDSDGEKISGIIGTRFLMHFLSSIDYKNQQFILRQKTNESQISFKSRLSDTVHKIIPINMFYTHLILVEGSFNGQNKGLYIVDTGAAKVGLLSSQKKFKTSGVVIDWSKSKPSDSVGDETEALVVTLNKVEIGSGTNKIRRTNVLGVLMKEELNIFDRQLGFEIQGLLSHNLFKGSIVTFDFESMNLIIQR